MKIKKLINKKYKFIKKNLKFLEKITNINQYKHTSFFIISIISSELLNK